VARKTRPLEERFWDKVDKSDGCWLWTAALNPDGYGRFVVQMSPQKVRGAHRVAWELMNGAIPNGLSVLHQCDTPACVNPEHLFLGTQQDNVADMVAKGRWNGHSPTHCPAGHPYDEENTSWRGNTRRCKACWRARRQKVLDAKGRITSEERSRNGRYAMHLRWHAGHSLKRGCEFCYPHDHPDTGTRLEGTLGPSPG